VADKYLCFTCEKPVTATKNSRYRSHTDGKGNPCPTSSEPIPEHVLGNPADGPSEVPQEGLEFAVCPQCERKVKLTALGYYLPHDTTLRGGERCPLGGVRHKHARTVEDKLLPGDVPASAHPKLRDSEQVMLEQAGVISPALTSTSVAVAGTPKELPPGGGGPTEPSSPTPAEVNLKRDPMPEPSPESPSTAPPSNEPEPEQPKTGPFSLGTSFSPSFLQPFSPFQQPGEIPVKLKLADAMSDRGKEIAARLRETFYAYTNRNSSDNRSAQIRMGPSEAGSPCDRQIAMKLMNITPVNPQEGWAPFIGTAVHAELAKMFEWANGSNSGRYVTEMRVKLPSEHVPYGTLDLLDRVLYMVDDHKLLGRWSLDKLIQEGPSETYLVQGQIYGLGAVLAGEKVKEIAIIGWPRQESSLDKLYVHVMPFDRKIAEAAIRRVDGIAAKVKDHLADAQNGLYTPMDAAREFPAGDDCKWCPFHLKGDKNMERGCPGK